MAARKRSRRAGPKCSTITTKNGTRVKRCWGANGKFIKTPRKARKKS